MSVADEARFQNNADVLGGWFRTRREKLMSEANMMTSETDASVYHISDSSVPETQQYSETASTRDYSSSSEIVPARDHRRPFWLTEGCPAWCQAEHGDADHPLDRRHVSASMGGVVLTQVEAVEADGTWQPQDVEISLSQHIRETEPLIWCHGRGQVGTWHLTVEEARGLAAALGRAVEAYENR